MDGFDGTDGLDFIDPFSLLLAPVSNIVSAVPNYLAARDQANAQLKAAQSAAKNETAQVRQIVTGVMVVAGVGVLGWIVVNALRRKRG